MGMESLVVPDLGTNANRGGPSPLLTSATDVEKGKVNVMAGETSGAFSRNQNLGNGGTRETRDADDSLENTKNYNKNNMNLFDSNNSAAALFPDGADRLAKDSSQVNVQDLFKRNNYGL